MKQFALFGVFFLMLAVALASMPQMPEMPQMPGKHLGQILNSGFLKQSAGQQGPPRGQNGPPPPHGQNDQN
ncbi:uncharacterized protein [Drosophila virilis]|uniref:Uncharacterized protein n=1 Tax=Drosophila virilis TaxID=7244 RepID=B4LN38_DROVI|nr:uncharacterized protein Dvir_GJ21088 [Drosophila virilis]